MKNKNQVVGYSNVDWETITIDGISTSDIVYPLPDDAKCQVKKKSIT
jgi:hypothetical protein